MGSALMESHTKVEILAKAHAGVEAVYLLVESSPTTEIEASREVVTYSAFSPSYPSGC